MRGSTQEKDHIIFTKIKDIALLTIWTPSGLKKMFIPHIASSISLENLILICLKAKKLIFLKEDILKL